MRSQLALLLILSMPALGSITTPTVLYVRTTGNDANSGGFDSTVASPGTNYSKQNAPQIAFTDILIGTPNTTFTSASCNAACMADIVGNDVRVTGGAGCTTALFTITSQAAGVATVVGALGTIGSTCTGNLGGALQTIPGLIAAQVFQPANSAQAQACIESGTYTLTTSAQLNSSPWVAWIGYQTTCGDNGTRPLITTSTNNTILLVSNNTGVYGGITFQNINFSNTAGVRAAAIDSAAVRTSVQVINCQFDGFTSAFSSSNATSWTYLAILNSEIKNSSGIAVSYGSNNNTGMEQLVIANSWIHDSGSHGIQADGIIHVERSIISANTGSGMVTWGNLPRILYLDSNDWANNGASGVIISGMASSGTAGQVTFANRNNVFYGNAAKGLSMPADIVTPTGPNWYNAYGSNGTGDRVNVPTGTGDVALSASPFTSSTNFALNATAGGAALKGVGYPGAFPGGSSTGALDIGAVQSAAAAGAGTSAFATAQ